MEWRTESSLARPHDSCAGCPSATLEHIPGADHRLCGRTEVVKAFGRARISAAMAHAEVCRGRYHPRYPKETR